MGPQEEAKDIEASHIHLRKFCVVEAEWGSGSLYPPAILKHRHGTPLRFRCLLDWCFE